MIFLPLMAVVRAKVHYRIAPKVRRASMLKRIEPTPWFKVCVVYLHLSTLATGCDPHFAGADAARLAVPETKQGLSSSASLASPCRS